MSLSLLHGGIALLGVAAATLPIIVHLLLKQRPKTIVFPAMRLITKKHTSTVRRLRLRHLLLLAMRMGLILLLGLALARPTLRSKLFSIDQQAPAAAMIIFDTSLSMEYKHHGKTRLDEAKELAASLVQRMPDGTEVTLINSATPATNVPLDIGASVARIKAAEIDPVFRPLNDALAVAYRGLAKSRQDRREVYVFTDLAANTWNLTDGERLTQLADLIEVGVRVYVINVGVEGPRNLSLDQVKLSQQTLTANSEVKLTVNIRNDGPIADCRVDLSIDGQARDVKPIQAPANQTKEITFLVPGLPEGLHQGVVTLNADDPLPFDNTRSFTIKAQAPIRSLVVADQPSDTIYWVNALAPAVLKAEQRERFAIDVIEFRQLAGTDLAPYTVVSMINVGSLSQDAWVKLANFVQGGGGLFVALGERVDSVSYDSQAAQSTLPGELVQEVRVENGVYLTAERFDHPVLTKFAKWESNDMSILPVLRYWKVKPGAQGTLTILPFSNGDPGLLERSFGEGKRGRCILLTTAAHSRPSADTWTEFPLGWSYVVLADQIMRYLAGVADTQLNFMVGSNVTMPLDPLNPFTLFSVTDPAGHAERLSVPGTESLLTIPSVKLLGNYRVDSTEAGRVFARGFSVNEPTEESDLSAIAPEKLQEIIGKDRLVVARDPAELHEIVDEARVGRELFPWLMLLIVGLVCAEGYFANRFYRT